MANLITQARAKQSLLDRSSFTAGELAALDVIIAAVSEGVRNWCRQDFDPVTHDEVYSGGCGVSLSLRHGPVLEVTRVASGLTTVLEVTNTDAANMRATVQVGAEGLVLVRQTGGVLFDDDSVTWETCPTLTSVAAAVIALGHGWNARVVNGYGGRASLDLRSTGGAFSCARGEWAGIADHVKDFASYFVVEDEARLVLDARDWDDEMPSAWPRGVRVVYRSGYDPVPEAVQEACATWVASRFRLALRDVSLAGSVNTDGSSAAYVNVASILDSSKPPPEARVLLAPYRRINV